jgi:Phosphatase
MKGSMFGSDPSIDDADRWRPRPLSREQLLRGLLDGGMAGPVVSHDRENVLWKIGRLVEGDPDLQFGLRGLLEGRPTVDDVLAMVAAEAGFDPDPAIVAGPVPVDPGHVLDRLAAAGRRLALAAERGERMLLATGHPVGLSLLYAAVGDHVQRRGAKLIRPALGLAWREGGRHREIRYLRGVAMLTDRGSAMHTHSPGPMERILEEGAPDLVLADHGFAGAAIQAGIETLSVADVNDPAPVVAKWQGRTQIVIVMDDNVQPEDYWPCFQAIAAEFPGGGGGRPR